MATVECEAVALQLGAKRSAKHSCTGTERVGLWVSSSVVVRRIEAVSSVECEAVTLQLGAKWFAKH